MTRRGRLVSEMDMEGIFPWWIAVPNAMVLHGDVVEQKDAGVRKTQRGGREKLGGVRFFGDGFGVVRVGERWREKAR